MSFSTKGRYALRVMIDLAEHYGAGYTPMKSVADRQDISLKYLERILPSLTKAELIEGVHGKGGGYKLTKDPSEYNLWEIINAAEPELAPVACLEMDAPECSRAGICKTLPIWKGYYDVKKKYFSEIKLSDVLKN